MGDKVDWRPNAPLGRGPLREAIVSHPNGVPSGFPGASKIWNVGSHFCTATFVLSPIGHVGSIQAAHRRDERSRLKDRFRTSRPIRGMTPRVHLSPIRSRLMSSLVGQYCPV